MCFKGLLGPQKEENVKQLQWSPWRNGAGSGEFLAVKFTMKLKYLGVSSFNFITPNVWQVRMFLVVCFVFTTQAVDSLMYVSHESMWNGLHGAGPSRPSSQSLRLWVEQAGAAAEPRRPSSLLLPFLSVPFPCFRKLSHLWGSLKCSIHTLILSARI